MLPEHAGHPESAERGPSAQDSMEPGLAVAAGQAAAPAPDAGARLDRLRGSIDNIDAALVHLLAERFKFTQAVGRLKAEHGLPPADPGREERQIARLRSLAADADLDPEFAEKFIGFVIAEVIRHHERIAGGPAADGRPQAGA